MGEKPLTLAVFVEETHYQHEPGFYDFVSGVTPKDEVKKVWLGEVLLILKALWELYQLLKQLGIFTRWVATRKIRTAMRVDEQLRLAALDRIKVTVNDYVHG